MDGKQLHSEIVKLHHMIDEQYSKVFRELKARNVFKEGDFDGRDTDDIY